MALQTCHWTHKFAVGLIDMGTVSPRTHKPKIVNESLGFSKFSAKIFIFIVSRLHTSLK